MAPRRSGEPTSLALSNVPTTGPVGLLERPPASKAFAAMNDGDVPVLPCGSSLWIETTIKSPGSASSTKNGPTAASPSTVVATTCSQALIFWTGEDAAAMERSAAHTMTDRITLTLRKIDAAPDRRLTQARIDKRSPDMNAERTHM